MPSCMAGSELVTRQVRVQLIDDLDGGSAAECVPFSLDGEGFEIDLSEANAADLRAVLDPWIAAARRSVPVTMADNVIIHDRPSLRPEEAAQVREWANEHRMAISERGRIPFAVIRAFRAAH